jgi:hypothetical protein
MVEQPPSSITRELAEYLTRQFDKLTIAAANGVAGATQTFSRLVLDGPWNGIASKGQVFLNGLIGNRIDFNTNGFADPSFTTRSVGTKIVLFPAVDATNVDDAIGISAGVLWNSVNVVTSSFKWFGGTTLAAQLTGSGNFVANGSILSPSPTSGVGYTTGAGGAATQATSKTTTVTLNSICGTVTTASDALASGAVVSFTFNNSSWHSDHMVLDTVGGTAGAYTVGFSSISDGVVSIWIKNTSTGSLSQAIPIIFTIIKSVSS